MAKAIARATASGAMANFAASRRICSRTSGKLGVFAAVEVAVWQDLSARSHGPIGDALTMPLDAGKADETVRPDADARDVILLIGHLSRLDQPEFHRRARHLLRIVLDGLRRRDRSDTADRTG